MVIGSLGFFLHHIPGLELKKPATQKCQWAQTKKKPNKNLGPLVKGPGEGQPRKTDTFR